MKKTTHKKASSANTKPVVIQHTDVRQIVRKTQTVGDWRTAMKAAESVTNPTRKLLYDLYHDIILDAQLGNTTDTRKRKITNAKLQFTNANGEINEAVQDIINTEMFFDMLGDILDSRFWGYSVLEFSIADGVLKYELIDRKHIKPEFKKVVRNPSETSGIDYTEAPYDKYILHVGKAKDLGIYLSVAQYVIYKRGDFGDWAQFAEIFGMPFRFGKYDGYDENTRLKLNQALESMGSAAYAVFPENASIEVQQNNNNGNGELYEKLAAACDEQIAVRMLGQTMTTKDGSSLGQAKVHADVAEDVHTDDRKYILNVLNKRFKNILNTFGINTDGTFDFVDESKINLKDRVYIDGELSKHVVLPPEYWFKTYGIDMPDNYEQLVKEAADKKAAENQPAPVPTPVKAPNSGVSKREPINALYNPVQTQSLASKFLNNFNPLAKAQTAKISKADFKAMEKEAKRLATLIYNGELPDNYYVSETMVDLINGHLKQAIESGYGNTASFAADSADTATLKLLNENTYKFSAAKNYNMLRDMKSALINSKGERVSLNEFNRAVENLNLEYNRRWQETEYNTAQSSSQMASKYNQFQNEAEAVPMLIFKTANDEHVRADHKPLNNMVAPANDPIWQQYWPPLDWGCRCDVIQHENDNVKRKVPNNDHMPTIGKGFEGNSATTGQIFDKNHPYFKGVPNEVAAKIFK